MGQDLRKLFEKERDSKKYPMKEGHEARFLKRLDSELPLKEKYSSFFWLRIAASVVVLLGIGTYFFLKKPVGYPIKNTAVAKEDVTKVKEGISLGDLSPDFEKIENYYVANINYELSQLDVSNDNKEMVDGYMERLGELDKEYGELNKELNDLGPNDDTISALIQNLQLRLQLLQKLKQKLNQLKSSENEQETHSI
ncbi:MAG: hypothetical protein AAF039_09135 [Bacteroidota bacterium]